MSTSGPEKVIGVWRRSMASPGFWWRVLISVGTYFILWRKNQITLTNRRITQRIGNILGGQEISMSLENVTDVSITKSAWGSLLGYSNVRIQSAGSNAAEIAFDGLADANKLKDAIFDLKDGVADDAAKKK